MNVFKFFKIWYWDWVIGCCKEDIMSIDVAFSWLNPEAKRLAKQERKQVCKELKHARQQLDKALGGRA